MTLELTAESKKLLLALVEDADNWGGTCSPSYEHITPETRGNLTDLKRHQLATTFKDNGIVWIEITPAGFELAATIAKEAV